MKSNITNHMLSFWEASHNDFPVTQKHIHPCHQRVQYISSKSRFVVQSTISYNCNTYKYQRASNKNYIHFPVWSVVLQTLKHILRSLEDWFLRHKIQGQLILKIRGRRGKAIKLPVTIFNCGKACFKLLNLLKRTIWVAVSSAQRQNTFNKLPRLVCSHPLWNSAFIFHIFSLTPVNPVTSHRYNTKQPFVMIFKKYSPLFFFSEEPAISCVNAISLITERKAEVCPWSYLILKVLCSICISRQAGKILITFIKFMLHWVKRMAAMWNKAIQQQ